MTTLEPPKSRAREWIASLALLGCILIVLFATMWPTPLDRDYAATIQKFIVMLHRNGIPEWYGYNKLEFSANMLMFVPLGFLLAMLLPAKTWWLALVVCPALSVGIELTQATFLSERFATVSDVIANSIGALVGVFCALVLRAVVLARDEKLIARALWEHQFRR